MAVSGNAVCRLMEARSVAIVGASERPGAPSGFVLRNLMGCGFSGAILPVHPSEKRIFGLSAVPQLSDLPLVPDVVVVAIPAAGAVAVVRQAAAMGIPGAVILASGSCRMPRRSMPRTSPTIVPAATAVTRGPDSTGRESVDPIFGASVPSCLQTGCEGGCTRREA